jgi:undecaprenyl-diphosphatase
MSGPLTAEKPGPLGERGPLGPSEPAGTTPAPAIPPQLGLAVTTVIVGLALVVATLVVLGSIADGVRGQEVFALDTWATPFFHSISSPAMDVLMNGFTDLGSSLVIPPLLVIVIVWLAARRRYRPALFLTSASAGSVILQGSMKLVFARPRPQLPWANVLPDYSFPSGHTMNAVVFYGALALIIWSIYGRRAGVIAVAATTVIAILVGISRIYLGYHYLTDVAGGILAGVAWLLVAGAAFRAEPTWRRWRSSPVHPPGGAPGLGGDSSPS